MSKQPDIHRYFITTSISNKKQKEDDKHHTMCITCNSKPGVVNSQCRLCAWVHPIGVNINQVDCIVHPCEKKAQFSFRDQEYCEEHMPCKVCRTHGRMKDVMVV